MRIDGDDIKFRSGRVETANRGIVGIYLDEDNEYQVCEGYDGGIPNHDKPLTRAEREELAAFMIDQWCKYGTKEVVD